VKGRFPHAQQLIGATSAERCDEVMMKRSSPIGGHGIRMQIDESKFGKRKYHRGKLLVNSIFDISCFCALKTEGIRLFKH